MKFEPPTPINCMNEIITHSCRENIRLFVESAATADKEMLQLCYTLANVTDIIVVSCRFMSSLKHSSKCLKM